MSIDFYETHIHQLIDNATMRINESVSLTGKQKSDYLNASREFLEKARQGLDELNQEVSILPTNEKVVSQRKIQAFQTRINELEQRINDGYNRSKLLEDVTIEDTIGSYDSNLNGASQSVSKSLDMGNTILTNLMGQRNKLLHSKSVVDDIDSTVSVTGKMIGKMEKIARQNRYVVYLIGVILSLGIFILLFLR